MKKSRWILALPLSALLAGCGGGGGGVTGSYGNGLCYVTMNGTNIPVQCPQGKAAGSLLAGSERVDQPASTSSATP